MPFTATPARTDEPDSASTGPGTGMVPYRFELHSLDRDTSSLANLAPQPKVTVQDQSRTGILAS